MNTDIRKYPIALLKDLKQLLIELKDIARQNSDIIEVAQREEDLFYAKELHPSSNFYFRIYNPSINNREANYYFEKKPHSDFKTDNYTGALGHKGILSIFEGWIEIIREYHSITLSEEDEFVKQAEQEFYDEFEIVEDDELNMKALPLEGQRKLYKLLEQLQGKLENEPKTEQINELIKETEVIKEDISKLPRGALAKRVAKLIVKMKKLGLKLFFDIVDVTYKEAIKYALKGGIDGISHLVNNS